MKLIFNEVRYEYDIRGLITSFFPGTAVETKAADQQEEKENQKTAHELSSWEKLLLSTACSYGLRTENQSEVIEEIPLPVSQEETDNKKDIGNKENIDTDETVFCVFYHKAFTAVCAAGGGHCWCSAAFADSSEGMEKNPLKRMTYGIFSIMTGGKLHPWGTLTGIRPVKLPMAMLEQGFSDEEIEAELKREYLIGDEKCRLSIQIAHRERALLDLLDYEDGYSLYVGIPFCPTTCLYCSFTSYPYSRWEKRMEEYVEALEKEIRFVQQQFAGKKLNTIYFGGGTPTTLPPAYLDRILGRITDGFDLSHLKEWTVEGGRPDSITPEKLEVISRYPVDRISINPQTMKQETLDLIGRRHTVEDVKKAFYMAREAGFDNINMDLIIGLPQEHADDVARTMEEITALNPDNLTVHTLAIKRASRLNMEKEQYGHLYLEQNTAAMMDITARGAASMGMEPYYLYRQKNMSGNLENVGYAKPGKEGIYNILIMEEKQSIVALGAGSVTKRVEPDHIERASNVKDIEQYLSRIDEMIQRKRELFASV
ncbi:MAG: coproporphyrinogen dehydrogenase HemZ [Lachnospiraceae bacterium]|nr:coproporphyrinogen dehydrogenase HemZ [Lachnospiraceae bacterium]